MLKCGQHFHEPRNANGQPALRGFLCNEGATAALPNGSNTLPRPNMAMPEHVGKESLKKTVTLVTEGLLAVVYFPSRPASGERYTLPSWQTVTLNSNGTLTSGPCP